jgi:5-methylcytosine-specific restriction endonuclease McrA
MKWTKKHRHTWKDKAPKNTDVFLEEHRVPPKPTYYYQQEKGTCRFCGKLIIVYTDEGERVNKRKRWHSNCIDLYNTMYRPAQARKLVWQRDRGECAICRSLMERTSRSPKDRWHVDHVRPLWEQKGKRFDELDYSYWELENLQTLCAACHMKKTAEEATKRAELKKEGK